MYERARGGACGGSGGEGNTGARTRGRACMRVRASVRACLRVRKHTHTCARARAHTHTHTHTHLFIIRHALLPPLLYRLLWTLTRICLRSRAPIRLRIRSITPQQRPLFTMHPPTQTHAQASHNRTTPQQHPANPTTARPPARPLTPSRPHPPHIHTRNASHTCSCSRTRSPPSPALLPHLHAPSSSCARAAHPYATHTLPPPTHTLSALYPFLSSTYAHARPHRHRHVSHKDTCAFEYTHRMGASVPSSPSSKRTLLSPSILLSFSHLSRRLPRIRVLA